VLNFGVFINALKSDLDNFGVLIIANLQNAVSFFCHFRICPSVNWCNVDMLYGRFDSLDIYMSKIESCALFASSIKFWY